jgi:hypothetical protein
VRKEEFSFTMASTPGTTALPPCRYTSLGNGTAMKAGVGLVVRSKRAVGPGGRGWDEGADDDELQAAERASSSGKRGKRMATV